MFIRVYAFYNTTQRKLLIIKRCNIDFVSIQQSCKTDRKFPDILLKYFIKQYFKFYIWEKLMSIVKLNMYTFCFIT